MGYTTHPLRTMAGTRFFEFKKVRSGGRKKMHFFDCYMQIDDAEAQKTGLFDTHK